LGTLLSRTDVILGRSVSLAPLTVLELPPDEMVACAAQAGYDAVGLRLIPATPTEPRWESIGRTRLIKDVKRRLDDSGLRLLDVEIVRIAPDSEIAHDFEPLLETAAFLGARHVLVAGNDPDPTRLAENLARFASLASTYNLSASIEFMPWTAIPDLRSAAELLQGFTGATAGILVDALHFFRSDSRIDDLLQLAPSAFHSLQLCDAPGTPPPSLDEFVIEARTNRLMPGEGELDLASLLQALPPDLPLSVEVPVAGGRLGDPHLRASTAMLAVRDVLSKTATISED